MWRIVSLALAIVIAGCSTVKITKVFDSTYSDGLRFYRPELYLLVTMDKDGNLQTSVIALPNKSEEYVIRPNVRFGAVEVNVTLESGWNLTQLGNKIDAKIPETISALTGTLQAAGGIAALRTSLPFEPGLYQIEFDKKSGIVSGIRSVPLKE
jgi:hypothetical protein